MFGDGVWSAMGSLKKRQQKQILAELILLLVTFVEATSANSVTGKIIPKVK